ncbi:hypothetical protein EV138_5807 [Kribbella voronezhensis]|uniref:Uncharacterized protein n=1 Tax=Kribbella voronezhensis TaxID=2512212 RepID=A0A4V3FIQ4_9ACTN|nr:hypothetical protein [Kribbella voronezhensis]TDU83343.1 hypothetical protein EV138_5807 [Kribbella voronezhensis]
MRRYRRAWKAAGGLLAAIGVAAALMMLPVSIDAVVFGMTAAIAGSIKFSLDLAADHPARRAAYIAVPVAVGAGVIGVAVCGYAATAGVGTVALIAVVVATSPSVVSALSARECGVGPMSAAKDAVDSPAPARPQSGPVAQQPLGDLSDLELCSAWRRSYLALQRATSPTDRLRIVQQRQGFLDELERRGPHQLAEWLHAGARAAGDPAKHFRRDPHRTS